MLKPTFIIATTIATGLGLTTAVQAADHKAPVIEIDEGGQTYVAARIGLAFAEDTEFDLNNAAVVPTGIINEYDRPDFTGALALGYEFGGGLRGEVEVSYSETDIESHTVTALGARFSSDNAFGSTKTTTGLVNGYYDMDWGTLNPYVSAGIGYSKVEFDNHGITLPAGGVAGLPGGNVTAMDDEDSALTWQVGVGVGIEVTSNTTFEMGYRLQTIEDVTLTAVDGSESEVDFTTHNMMSGLRFNF